ncbi:MAG: alpha/beta hydrolase-fold protein [Marinifilaceae bacterium]
MKHTILLLFLIFSFGVSIAQQVDTFYLHQPISKYDTIDYIRIIQFDKNDSLYHVWDYYPSGQIQMEGTYSSFDRNIKEKYWCNYRGNTKQGLFRTWYKNGQLESRCNFVDGRFQGLKEEWFSNGQISQRSQWKKGNMKGNGKGQMHGFCKCWTKEGKVNCDMVLKKGLKVNPRDTNYHYISYTPKDYNADTLRNWPLIIYLHGGTARGTDTLKLYNYGIPDQIWKGREFPFLIVAPQCPLNHRWSTDNWFENFYEEITTKFRVDTNRVYLTGVSLGGAGTWYLAIKHPDKFAAIAPMSGFSSHIQYIYDNVDRLCDMPTWAFHGKRDLVAQYEDTERMIQKLEGKNKNLKLTAPSDKGHELLWFVYPEQELYNWFLQHSKGKSLTKGL